VKAGVFQYLPLCVFLLAACGPTESRSPAHPITFDTSKGLDDFEFATAGDGKPGEWSIVENDAGRVLAQIDTDPADNRFPLAVYRPFSGRDVYVSIRFMTISGETDQAAGVFVRFASVDNYYAARASALENNVGLYRVVAGKREMIGCRSMCRAKHGTLLASRRETNASPYFSTAGSFLLRPTGGFRGPPAKLACGPKPTA
jgi:hypothetical protein